MPRPLGELPYWGDIINPRSTLGDRPNFYAHILLKEHPEGQLRFSVFAAHLTPLVVNAENIPHTQCVSIPPENNVRGAPPDPRRIEVRDVHGVGLELGAPVRDALREFWLKEGVQGTYWPPSGTPEPSDLVGLAYIAPGHREYTFGDRSITVLYQQIALTSLRVAVHREFTLTPPHTGAQ